MARYKGTITSRHSAEAVWRYLSDLRSTAEWDPSVKHVSLTGGEPGTTEASYQLEVAFLGSTISLPYETGAVESPTRVTFDAETDSVSVHDEARLEPMGGGGCSVTWDAELRLKGARRLFEPLLRLGFSRLGRRAARGLDERLNEPELSRPLEGVHA